MTQETTKAGKKSIAGKIGLMTEFASHKFNENEKLRKVEEEKEMERLKKEQELERITAEEERRKQCEIDGIPYVKAEAPIIEPPTPVA